MKNIILMVMLLYFNTNAAIIEPTVDTTSLESMKVSMERVREYLPQNQQKLLVLSMRAIVYNKMESFVVDKNLKGVEVEIERLRMLNEFLRKKLHGMTGSEIIDFAATLK